jgi:hypothetical protein
MMTPKEHFEINQPLAPAPRTIEKIKILGVISELPAEQHRQFEQSGPSFR